MSEIDQARKQEKSANELLETARFRFARAKEELESAQAYCRRCNERVIKALEVELEEKGAR